MGAEGERTGGGGGGGGRGARGRHSRGQRRAAPTPVATLLTSPDGDGRKAGGSSDGGSAGSGGSGGREKERCLLGGRVLRSRRYRRPFHDHRHTKRLFTPEIKRFLKGWLVRRRDNPYPNRDEKKGLAVQTGLTYIQICNWFANWRRKLKNASSEARQRTWSNLIKSYNTQAQGNVEQFSICSDDSIWEEEEDVLETDHNGLKKEDIKNPASSMTFTADATAMDHCYSALFRKDPLLVTPQVAQCSQISSTTAEEEPQTELPLAKASPASSNKYKSHMMEKYLKNIGTDGGVSRSSEILEEEEREQEEEEDEEEDPEEEGEKSMNQRKGVCPPLLLSKWLESAAKYQPGQSYIAWSAKNVTWRSTPAHDDKEYQHWNVSALETSGLWSASGHLREELDAAVALTCLSSLQH